MRIFLIVLKNKKYVSKLTIEHHHTSHRLNVSNSLLFSILMRYAYRDILFLFFTSKSIHKILLSKSLQSQSPSPYKMYFFFYFSVAFGFGKHKLKYRHINSNNRMLFPLKKKKSIQLWFYLVVSVSVLIYIGISHRFFWQCQKSFFFNSFTRFFF